jgi:hypothetical protein
MVAVVAICIGAHRANAQCAPYYGEGPSSPLVDSVGQPRLRANELQVWKTIALGTHRSGMALRNALDSAQCGIGDTADEILGRPAFRVSVVPTRVALVVATAAALRATTLVQLYARAQQVGLSPAPAEIGPQLRLQYPHQPLGEYLSIGMWPVATYEGDLIILSVANGGTALSLLGEEWRPDRLLAPQQLFVFMRGFIKLASNRTVVPPRRTFEMIH